MIKFLIGLVIGLIGGAVLYRLYAKKAIGKLTEELSDLLNKLKKTDVS